MQQEASGNPILSPAWCADTRRGSVWICSLEPWALVTSALLALLGLLYLVTRGLTALLRCAASLHQTQDKRQGEFCRKQA